MRPYRSQFRALHYAYFLSFLCQFHMLTTYNFLKLVSMPLRFSRECRLTLFQPPSGLRPAPCVSVLINVTPCGWAMVHVIFCIISMAKVLKSVIQSSFWVSLLIVTSIKTNMCLSLFAMSLTTASVKVP